MNITTSASCSMAPDSRRSESCGPRSSRSGARVSWLSTSTGIPSSLARPFSARDARHFFLAVAKAAARGDELEVIDDQERRTLVALQPSGFGANLEDADRARIVDPQW